MKHKAKSTEIYSQLITGKYINKTILNGEDVYSENPLFEEIKINQDEYTKYYDDIGYELVFENDYFYLNKEKKEEEEDETFIDKNILKEYVLLTVLQRYMLDNKISIDRTLLDENVGLSPQQIEPMFSLNKYTNILTLTEMKTLSIKTIENVLLNKNIIMYNSKGHFVLTNIGKKFVDYVEAIGSTHLTN